MPVRNLIRKNVLTIESDQSVYRAANLMQNNNIGSVVVVEDGKPLGILTDRDITVLVVAEKLDPEATSSSEAVGSGLVSGSPGDRPEEIFQTMKEASVRRLPIVKDDELLGIVTMDDLIVYLRDRLDDLSEIVKFESPPYEQQNE